MTPDQARAQATEKGRCTLEIRNGQARMVAHENGAYMHYSAHLAAIRAARGEAYWPNVIAPPQHENPADGWIDPKLPDFELVWKLAREVGYAVGIHGSLKRDVDLIAMPWTDGAVGNAGLVEHLCTGLPATRVGGPEHKPHGRVAVTLQIDGYYKPIDLSICPRVGAERRSIATRLRARAKEVRSEAVLWGWGSIADELEREAAALDAEKE